MLEKVDLKFNQIVDKTCDEFGAPTPLTYGVYAIASLVLWAILSAALMIFAGCSDIPATEIKAEAVSSKKLTVGMSWQINLEGTPKDSSAETLFDVDLFETDEKWIKAMAAKGKIVICYFSAGSYEAWRPDSKTFPAEIKGLKMSGWDELWLDVKNPKTLTIMKKRIDLAKAKGCSGIDPDNVDGYANKTGKNVLKKHSVQYLKDLASYSHSLGLLIGLKNATDVVQELVPHMDFSVVEECFKYKECDGYKPMIAAGKPVFQLEYKADVKKACAQAIANKFSLINYSNLSLNGKGVACSK